MMPDYFARSVALRHLRSNVRQNLLTIGVVAVSITLVVYLSALIGALQRQLIANVTGQIPHIVVKQPEREPIATWDVPGRGEREPLYVGEAVRLQQRRQKIEDWAAWVPRLERFDARVVGVAATVEGQGFLHRAAKRKAVRLTGMVPDRYNAILDLRGAVVAGRFLGLNAGEVVLGRKLADEFGVRLGDKIRLVSEEGGAGAYTIAGIFDTGFTQIDEGSVFIPLKDAQALLALGTAVTAIHLKLSEVFAADQIADRMALQVPYEVESWMRKNENLLDALRTQFQSMSLILSFTVVAAGFGIAAILITAVMSRLREIGILKAIGATRRQILSVFALEGMMVAFLGSLVGVAGGAAVANLVERWWQTSIRARLGSAWEVEIRLELVLGAIALAVVLGFLAALYPAWRASRVDPVEVIRGA
jgi:lipoprotein-releasing system permease protein